MKHVLILLLILTSFCNCKKMFGSMSKIKSLDNFAAGRTVRNNQCVGNEDHSNLNFNFVINDDAVVIPKEKFSLAFSNAIKAVPNDILKMFSDPTLINGKIILSSRIGDYCIGAKACVKTVQFKNSSKAMLGIYISNDDSVVSFDLVRQFGFFFSQHLSYITDEQNRSVMLNAKAKLARLFLSDVVNKKLYSLKTMERYFGTESIKLLLMEIAKPSSNDPGVVSKGEYSFFERLSFKMDGESSVREEEHEYRLNSFLDLVAGEAFDSYFCNVADPNPNKNTRSIMSREFSVTFKSFPAVYNSLTDSIATGLAQRSGKSFQFRKLQGSASGLALSEDGATDSQTSEPTADPQSAANAEVNTDQQTEPQTEPQTEQKTEEKVAVVEDFAKKSNPNSVENIEAPERVQQEDTFAEVTTTGVTEPEVVSDNKTIPNAPEEKAKIPGDIVIEKSVEVAQKTSLNIPEKLAEKVIEGGVSISPRDIVKGATVDAVKAVALDAVLAATDGNNSIGAKALTVAAAGTTLAMGVASVPTSIVVLGPTELINVASSVKEQEAYVRRAEEAARKSYRENKDAIVARGKQMGEDPLTENEFVTVAKAEALVYKQKLQKQADGRSNPLLRIAEVFSGPAVPPTPPQPHSIDFYYKDIQKFPGGRRQYK